MNDEPTRPQPYRPPVRGANHYAILKGEFIKKVQRRDLFTVTISATSVEGEPMDNEQKLLIDLVFKPTEKGFKLRPAETQLLLAYMSEILKEIEEEEKVILAEEKSVNKQGDESCK